jgi:hypothetical protein
MNLRGSPDYDNKTTAVWEWDIATVGLVNGCWSSPAQSILNHAPHTNLQRYKTVVSHILIFTSFEIRRKIVF